MDLIKELQNALKEENFKLIELLENERGHEFLVNLKDKLGRSMLHWASKNPGSKSLKWVLDKGYQKIDDLDSDGTSALMIASMSSNVQAVKLLLENGANPDLKQKFGNSAKTFAIHNKNQEIISMLNGNLNQGVELDSASVTSEVSEVEVDAQELKRAKAQQLQEMQTLIERLSETANGVEVDILESSAGSKSHADVITNPAGQKIEISGLQEQGLVQHKLTSKEEGRANLEGKNMAPTEVTLNWSEKQKEAYKALMGLGFEDLTEKAKREPFVGRQKDVQTIMQMLNKGQNPLIVGDVGSGKTSCAQLVAESLGKEGKVLLQVPETLLRGNKYAGSVNENIRKWLDHVIALQGVGYIFVDDSTVLGTGRTSSDDSDTPAKILRPHLDQINTNGRVVMLGAVNQKQNDVLKEDDNFYRLLSPYNLLALTMEQTNELLKSSQTIKRLEKQNYVIDDVKNYENVIDHTLPMLQKFIFNQSFPKKAFDFVQYVLHDRPISSVSLDVAEEIFSKFFTIPIEIVRAEIEEGSAYATLSEKLKEGLIGQDHSLDNLASGVTSSILLNNSQSRAPTSFLMMGPTGVGKTEASERLSKILDLPIISFNMGEFKNINSISTLIDNLSTFLVKNYSGVILFDEIEKAHPQVLDIFLSLLDKGVVGSGNSKVYCGSQIVIGTTNIAASETMNLKKTMGTLKGHFVIDEDWLRQRLIEEGMREEIINRFTKVLDFNHITPEVALKIGASVFSKKAQALKESKNVQIDFEDDFVRQQIVEDFDDRFGARGIIRGVNEVFERIISNPQVMVKLRKNTNLKVQENDKKQLIISIKDSTGAVTEVMLQDKKTNVKKDLDDVFNALKMKSMQALVEKMKEHPSLNGENKEVSGPEKSEEVVVTGAKELIQGELNFDYIRKGGANSSEPGRDGKEPGVKNGQKSHR